jgi:hypothetical protein
MPEKVTISGGNFDEKLRVGLDAALARYLELLGRPNGDDS